MILASAGNFGISFILEFIGLVVVFAIIRRYIWPPLNKKMNERLDSIKTQLAAGDQARAEAARLVAEKNQALKAAETEATQIIEQAKKNAEFLVEDGKRRADEEYERLVARITQEIEAARLRMRQEVLTLLGEVVLVATKVVVQAELDESGHHRLIDEAIAATEAESNGAVV